MTGWCTSVPVCRGVAEVPDFSATENGLMSAAMKKAMSLVIAVALALDLGSLGAKVSVSVFSMGYGTVLLQCLDSVCVLSVARLPFIISTGYTKCCHTNDLKVVGASSMTIFLNSDLVLAALHRLQLRRLLSFSFFLSVVGRLYVAKAHYCPPQVDVWVAQSDRLLPCDRETAFHLNEKYHHDLIS